MLRLLAIGSLLAMSCRTTTSSSSKGAVNPAVDKLRIDASDQYVAWTPENSSYKELLKKSLASYRPSQNVTLKFKSMATKSGSDVLDFRVEDFQTGIEKCTNGGDCYGFDKSILDIRNRATPSQTNEEIMRQIGTVEAYETPIRCNLWLKGSLYSAGGQELFQTLKPAAAASARVGVVKSHYKISKIETSVNDFQFKYILTLTETDAEIATQVANFCLADLDNKVVEYALENVLLSTVTVVN